MHFKQGLYQSYNAEIVHNLTSESSKRVPRVTKKKTLYTWKLDQGGSYPSKDSFYLRSSLSGETPMRGGGRKNMSTLITYTRTIYWVLALIFALLHYDVLFIFCTSTRETGKRRIHNSGCGRK